MPIKYALFKSHLTNVNGAYTAQVQINASVGLDELVTEMERQGSTVQRADAMAVIENAITAAESLLLKGMRVNFGGLCDFVPSIAGKFTGETDSFDPSRHQLDVAAVAGSRIRNTVRSDGQVEKVAGVKPAPILLEVVDSGSNTTNTTMTVGNIVTINGENLKYDTEQADEGIYFVPVAGGQSLKPGTVQRNKPSQLVFLCPADLTPGNYWLEVRARLQGGDTIRIGRSEATLIVA